MKQVLILIALLLSSCSGSNNFDTEILGEWEVYSLNGKTELYKAFIGTTYTFNKDGTYTRSQDDKTYVSGSYQIDGDSILLKARKNHTSRINISSDQLNFDADPGFTSGGKPMKSIYSKVK